MESDLSWSAIYDKHFDPEQSLRDIYATDSGFEVDSMLQPMQNIHKFFTSEKDLKINSLIFYGATYNIHLLYPICDYVKEVIAVDFLHKNMDYLEKWMKNDPESFNWSQSIKSLNLSDKLREQCIENEEKTRKIIKQFVKGDLTESGPVAPQSLAQADCLFSPYCFSLLCKDIDSFIASVKSMSSLLKVGGYLLLYMAMKCTFCMIGKYKFPFLYIDEEHVKQILTDLGFSVKEVELNPRDNVSKSSITDFESVLFLTARKECETK